MTDEWPPRWEPGPHFKGAGSAKVARGKKREERVAGENAQMRRVRTRDKYCRFPLCDCKRFKLRLEVSHSRHRGSGGNPAGDRSVPDLMVLVCSARHKENVFSLDRKTIRWRALTPRGSNGPIAWDISIRDMRRLDLPDWLHPAFRDWPAAKWFELAVETTPHAYAPRSPAQTDVLAWLAGMEKF